MWLRLLKGDLPDPHRVETSGLNVKFAVLYGSHARGQANDMSDIDLILVSPQFDPLHKREDINRMWIIAGQVDNRIEPIACGEKEWEENDSIPLLEIARREGIKIAA